MELDLSNIKVFYKAVVIKYTVSSYNIKRMIE